MMCPYQNFQSLPSCLHIHTHQAPHPVGRAQWIEAAGHFACPFGLLCGVKCELVALALTFVRNSHFLQKMCVEKRVDRGVENVAKKTSESLQLATQRWKWQKNEGFIVGSIHQPLPILRVEEKCVKIRLGSELIVSRWT